MLFAETLEAPFKTAWGVSRNGVLPHCDRCLHLYMLKSVATESVDYQMVRALHIFEGPEQTHMLAASIFMIIR